MKKQSIFDKMKRQDGSALLLTIVVFLVVVIVLMSSSMLALANFRKSDTASKYTSTYYVAETGAKQYLVGLESFILENADKVKTNPSNLGALFALENNSVDSMITYDFGSLMNESSNAEVQLVYQSSEANVHKYRVIAKGSLGSNARTVMTEISVQVASVAKEDPLLSIDIPAVMGFDPNSSKESVGLNFNGYRPRLEGPFITTNSAAKYNSGPQTWYGPFVFGGNLNDYGGLTSHNPIIIFGDYILDGWDSEIEIMILMNMDSKINFKTAGGTIEYLYVPTNYDLTSIKLPSGESLNRRVKNVVRFNPVNFDPYKASGYTANKPSDAKIKTLFGEEGAYPYKTYFSESFYLNHLDDPEIMSKVVPNYKMPPFPTLGSSTHPWINQTDTASKSSNVTISNNEISLNNTSKTPTLVLNSNISVKKVSGNAWNTIKINIGNKDIEILTESLDIRNSTIELIGTGSLTFIVPGVNGVVETFNFSPKEVIQKTGENSSEKTNDPTKLKFIVGKTNKGSGSKTLTTLNNQGQVDAIFITQDLNLTINNAFHGVFVSLEGTSFTLTNVGNASFSGLTFMPKGIGHLENDYAGSLLVKAITGSQTGYQQSEYSGSLNDAFIEEVMDYLNYENNGPSLGNSGGSSGGGSVEHSFEIIRSPLREIEE